MSAKTKKNVIGETYNLLTIISDAPSKREPSGTLIKMVNVKCSCGNIKENKPYREIKRGKLKSCGCISQSIKIKAEPGDKFNHWTLIEENKFNKKLRGRNFTCQCVCGTIRVKSFKELRKGIGKSCGCFGLPPKEKIVREKIIPQDTEEERWKESISFPNYYISSKGGLFSYNKQYMFSHRKINTITVNGKEKELRVKNEVYKTFTGEIPKGFIVTDDFKLKELATDRVKKLKNVYSAMIYRCTNESSPDYKRYGSRGIKIEESLDSIDKFIRWSLNNGFELGKNLSIDRIDNDRNYSSENCQWITLNENCRKNSNNKLSKEIAFEIREGKYKDTPIKVIAEIFNCTTSAIQAVKNGKTWV